MVGLNLMNNNNLFSGLVFAVDVDILINTIINLTIKYLVKLSIKFSVKYCNNLSLLI